MTAALAHAVSVGIAKIQQDGLNFSMLSTGVVAAGIAAILIGGFAAAGTQMRKYGADVTTTGSIIGGLAVIGAGIANMFLGVGKIVLTVASYIVNSLQTVGNFVGNVFVDPVAAVKLLFLGMADKCLGVLSGLAGAVDTIFGTNLKAGIEGWRGKISALTEEIKAASPEELNKLGEHVDFTTVLDKFAFKYDDVYAAGVEFGNGLERNVIELLSGGDKMPDYNSQLDEIRNSLSDLDYNTGDIGDIKGNTAAM